jgi:uncharacterized protein (TIGR00661 family)
MNILYGINGEGLGHINRSKHVIDKLRDQGHTVYKACMLNKELSDGDTCIHGVRLKFKNRKIKKIRAIIDYLRLPTSKDVRLLEQRYGKVDLVITDFESTVARYARKNEIPLVSIDNQHRFYKIDYSMPLKYVIYNILLSICVRVFIGKTDDRIVTCFHPQEASYDVLCGQAETKENGTTLVYLKDEFVPAFIKNYKDLKTPTYIYCKSPGSFLQDVSSNIMLCPLGDSFKRRLLDCSRVISNGGNQIIGECIQYNKPITCIPIIGQIEQEMNAYYLEKHNLGGVTTIEELKINNKKPDVELNRGIDKLMERLGEWLK